MLLDVLETMFFSGLQKNQRKKTLAGQKFRTPEVRVALLIAPAINCNCSIKSDFLFITSKNPVPFYHAIYAFRVNLHYVIT